MRKAGVHCRSGLIGDASYLISLAEVWVRKFYGRPSYGELFRRRTPSARGKKKYVPPKPSGKAAILTLEQFDAAEQWALVHSLYPERDRLFVQLSRYCAMRAKEIATIWLRDVTDVEGKLLNWIEISSRGAKYGKPRVVPMPPELVETLRGYLKTTGITEGPLFWSHRNVPMTSNAVQKRLKAIYAACGFEGARSHSGRRSAITAMARNIHLIDATLDDVRRFVGHVHLQTTQEYIEPDPEAGTRLQEMIVSRTMAARARRRK